MTESEMKTRVKAKYNQLARDKQDCCGTADCSFIGESYTQLEGYIQDADLGLGCGLPTKYAGIQVGDTVVDLGSGAGNDVFIARQEAGAEGHVIGIDMAEDMIERAQSNLRKLGFQNVEFRLGDIEDIPMANDRADVVVSNCVMNLVPDKRRAYTETFRILKPGGHFCISDVVIRGELNDALREAAELYAGCVSGAMDIEAYMDIIRSAGFQHINIQRERRVELSEELLGQYLKQDQKAQFLSSGVGIYSVTLTAQKPSSGCCGDDCCD